MDTHGQFERGAAAGSSQTRSNAVTAVDEFSIVPDAKPAGPHRLHHVGRFAMPIPADRMEAQYRFADGSTLLLASRTRRFAEALDLLYLGPDLVPRDHLIVGGAYTPGYLVYAEPCGPAAIAFCWHEHEQVVTVRPRRTLFGWRTRWLSVTDRPATE